MPLTGIPMENETAPGLSRGSSTHMAWRPYVTTIPVRRAALSYNNGLMCPHRFVAAQNVMLPW